MATDSSILAYRTPWAEEPDGLLGLQRVGDDWATNHSTAQLSLMYCSEHTAQLYLSSLPCLGLNASSKLT